MELDNTEIKNAILLNFLFEAYSIDSKDLQSTGHFSVAPGDIIKVDLEPIVSRLREQLIAIKNATYGQLEYDDVLDEVRINGKASPTAPSATQTSTTQTPAQQKPPTKKRSASSGIKKDDPIKEFLKKLKDSGELDKIKFLDPNTKADMASKMIKLVKKTPIQPRPTQSQAPAPTPTPTQTTPAPTAQLPEEDLSDDDDLLLKEAFIYLVEVAGGNKNKANVKGGVGSKALSKSATPVAPATPATSAAPATPAAPAAPVAPAAPATSAAPATQQQQKLDPNNEKIFTVMMDPKAYGVDANSIDYKKKLEFIRKSISEYKKYNSISNKRFVGIVKNYDMDKNIVTVSQMNQSAKTADNKSTYDKTGKEFDVPLTSITSKIPGKEKKGFLGKVKDWFTN